MSTGPSPSSRSTEQAGRGAGGQGAGRDDHRLNTAYRRMIAVCDALADAALEGVDAAQLTKVYADVVGRPVVLLDSAFDMRAEAGNDDGAFGWERGDSASPTPRPSGQPPFSIDRLFRALEAKRRPLRVPSIPGSLLEQGFLITPIVVEGDALGYLVVADDPSGQSDDVDVVTATYAATLFALTLAHERTSTELGQRFQRAVVDALVSGHFIDADDARQKARALGLDDAVPYRVGVVRGRSGTAATELADRLAGATPGLFAARRDSEVLVIVRDEAVPQLAALWPTKANEWAGALVTCGLSERLDHAELAPQGLREAEQAIELGTRLGRMGQVVEHADLGIYRLLLRIGDMRELWGFAEDVLGALIDYDLTHTLDLVRTLSEYLRHQGSLKQVSRTLRVHPNTVAYRAQRIEKLTGLDLSDPDDRLIAHIAVKIIEARRGTEPS